MYAHARTHAHTSAQNLHPSRKGQNRLVETGFRLGLKNGRVNVPAAVDAPGVREQATVVLPASVRALSPAAFLKPFSGRPEIAVYNLKRLLLRADLA